MSLHKYERATDFCLRDWRVHGLRGKGTCMECGKPATKQEAFIAEPWQPFCDEHGLPDYYEHRSMPFWRGEK